MAGGKGWGCSEPPEAQRTSCTRGQAGTAAAAHRLARVLKPVDVVQAQVDVHACRRWRWWEVHSAHVPVAAAAAAGQSSGRRRCGHGPSAPTSRAGRRAGWHGAALTRGELGQHADRICQVVRQAGALLLAEGRAAGPLQAVAIQQLAGHHLHQARLCCEREGRQGEHRVGELRHSSREMATQRQRSSASAAAMRGPHLRHLAHARRQLQLVAQQQHVGNRQQGAGPVNVLRLMVGRVGVS